MLYRFPIAAFLAVFALLALNGCYDEHNNVYATSYNAADAVDIAPVEPPPAAEDPPADLDPRTQVWRSGYWSYQSQRFVWVPGDVVTRPAPTAIWRADHWEKRTYGWVFVHGYWL